MRKKWVIIATTVFLGVVCGVFLYTSPKDYDFGEVKNEIFKDNEGGESIHLSLPTHKPLIHYSSSGIIENFVEWYKEYLSSEKSLSTFCVFDKDGDGLWVNLIGNHSRVKRVEISGTPLKAKNLKLRLTAKFPKLPCEIITPP